MGTMERETAAERDLVGLVKRNDAKAWEQVYVDLYPRLRAYAARRVGHDRASDVVAETMAKAVGSIGKFDPSGVGLSAWIFGICRHVVADTFRSAARSERHPIIPPVPVDEIGDRIEGDEEAAAMRVAYAKLSDDDREILDLRVIAGLSADDVAGVLDRKAGAVRMAQSRALERLRAHYKEVYR